MQGNDSATHEENQFTFSDDSLLFDQVNDAIIVTDTRLIIQRWNRGAVLLYGWQPQDAIGKLTSVVIKVERYIENGDARTARDVIAQTGTWRGIVVQRHNDGHELVVDSSIRAMHDKDGTTTGLIAINRNISERMQLLQREQEARANAEKVARRQRFLSEIASAFVTHVFDIDAMLEVLVRVVGERIGDLCCVRLLSADGASLVPGPIYHMKPFVQHIAIHLIPAVWPVTRGLNGQVVRSGKAFGPVDPMSEDVRHLIPETLQEYIDTVGVSSIIVVPMRAGIRTVGALFMARDSDHPPYTVDDLSQVQAAADQAALATENARLHNESQATLARLETVLTAAPVGICFLDTHLIYVQFNDAFAMLGGDPAIRVGGQAHEGQSALLDAMLPALRTTLRTGEPQIDQDMSEMSSHDEPGRFWLWSCYPVRHAANDIVGVGIVTVEVTQRKRLEAQLFLAQRMESLGRLASGVAHDFNNLLTAIVGYADLAITSLPSGDEVITDIEEIKKTAARASTLTRQLLTFARRSTLTPRLLDVNFLIADLEKLLQRLIGSQIELTLNLSPHLGTIRADPGQIEQVLINLVVNARDAMPDGGRLSIETTLVEADTITQRFVDMAPGRYVQVSVADTGMGMSQQTQSRAFEPFFTTKPIGQGTGLGLAISYGIIRQHEGRIAITSELGKGTTVNVCLPQADENESHAVAHTS